MSDPFLPFWMLRRKETDSPIVEEEIQQTYRNERQLRSIGLITAKELFRAWRSSIRASIRFKSFYGRKPPYIK